MPISLSSRIARRTALAGAAATLSIALAACSASFSAPTLQPYQAAEGTNVESGQVKVRNMLVLADAEGKGELHSAIINDGNADDTLVGIAQAPADTPDGVDGGWAPGEVTFGNVRTFTLKSGDALTLPPSTGQPITVTGVKPGQMLNVTITFGQAAPITAYIPVLTDDHYSPSPSAE